MLQKVLRGDAHAVDERAVRRPVVDEEDLGVASHDLGVETRGLGVVEEDVAARVTADHRAAIAQSPFTAESWSSFADQFHETTPVGGSPAMETP